MKQNKPKWREHFSDDWEFEGLIDEQLGTFWECIPGLEQKRWYTNELYLRNELKIQPIVDLPSFERLRTTQRKHYCLSSIIF
jgi:hypothetical protein